MELKVKKLKFPSIEEIKSEIKSLRPYKFNCNKSVIFRIVKHIDNRYHLYLEVISKNINEIIYYRALNDLDIRIYQEIQEFYEMYIKNFIEAHCEV